MASAFCKGEGRRQLLGGAGRGGEGAGGHVDGDWVLGGEVAGGWGGSGCPTAVLTVPHRP